MPTPDAERSSQAALEALSPAFSAPIAGRPGWDSRFAGLYELGKQQQWNAATDLNWKIDCPFGAPLPDESAFALAAFKNSPIGHYGRAIWDAFRWELQAWMVSQFLPGEQAAIIAAARLVEVVPDSDARLCLAGQVADEARHLEAFGRYAREKLPSQYPVSPSFATLLQNTLSDHNWDMTVLGMQILVETLALAAFRLADRTFHDQLIRDLCFRVARDESRHVSLGVLSLRSLYRELSSAELQHREEFVLESINLIRQRFLLEEIWERLGIPRKDGVEFASNSEVMIQYRQTICSKLVTALAEIGLMTNRVRDGFIRLDLLRVGSRLPAGLRWNISAESAR